MSENAGHLLRVWRQRRHLSQLDLANVADVSARHLSFLETGKSRPSSAMILRLCEHLEVPLREQNTVLLAGGYAPAHPEHALSDPPMAQANRAIEQILAAHEPWPALVVDRGWDLVTANDATYRLVDGVAAHLLEPPVNVIRLALHPDGLAARTQNLHQWRGHLLARIACEYEASADARLAALLEEFGPPGREPAGPLDLVVPLRLRVGDDVLSFISTTTVFGTPHEVTLSELAIETFYPADERTRTLATR
ncbi:helix-turn-helix transcriptional regulator [Luteipulveratus sp. YIM 133132]|uniref:helix-turn-helix transcriptional regulator n=1 Tax=Luteipulveratus flavus TaxID=3031728 RepID=UPI0023B1A3A5|nr:helix-turn-helix transcriptional regulator [Luteipulveratus sp. YIM 133132]MDE9366588.1 helix-turn-helix transcriptional regulator [Luteipulveratus sp. YIM 133132]